MITRQFQKDDAASIAQYSDCERYRYALTRVWDTDGLRLTYVMLNPSKATEIQNDPTIERCERRARTLGYGGFRAVNIFAWRETDPAKMKRAKDPIGPENDAALIDASIWTDHILCSWGTHGAFLNRGPDVLRLLKTTKKPMYHLGLTKDQHPRHPLYISYKTQPMSWF
ncbi:DUF1643 domain-containing protein [Cochlodiniinecator piscidefendens]|uniref:DUF1643 domain-containing protein n=1 Tax=Cochlodiniinecator piscidefendens TaxID=2715756 RepID=UPI00140D648B|nr:DUF1643 domain-containing protein [Cochlodiniinecator piscidefendens]